MSIGIRTVIFAGLFCLCVVGALFYPLLGVLGYVAHYMIGPERQWWERPLQHLGVRYSYVLALATFAGVAFNCRRLRFGRPLLTGQEKLLLLFLGVVWLVTLSAPQTVGRYTLIDHPSVKFTKIVVFVLVITHVVTDLKKLNYLLWVLVACSLILGLQAWNTPRRAFAGGRLETVGGVDFAESNFFAAYMAAMLVIVAIQFMRSKWIGKLFCALSGVFTANAIILTRSRGAVVGLAFGGVTALIMAPSKYRMKVAAGLVVAVLGIYHLTDPQFRQRAMTITREEGQRDSSAASRMRLAEAGVRMLMDHPMGIGVGNFYQSIGRYIPEYEGKDAHNTFVRCMTETGIAGICLFLAIILAGLLSLRGAVKRCRLLPDEHHSNLLYIAFGFSVAQVTLLGCCLTISLTYTEGLWWFLLLPTVLSRVMDNYVEDLEEPTELEEPKRRAEQDKPARRRGQRPPNRKPLCEPEPAGNHWR